MLWEWITTLDHHFFRKGRRCWDGWQDDWTRAWSAMSCASPHTNTNHCHANGSAVRQAPPPPPYALLRGQVQYSPVGWDFEGVATFSWLADDLLPPRQLTRSSKSSSSARNSKHCTAPVYISRGTSCMCMYSTHCSRTNGRTDGRSDGRARFLFTAFRMRMDRVL